MSLFAFLIDIKKRGGAHFVLFYCAYVAINTDALSTSVMIPFKYEEYSLKAAHTSRTRLEIAGQSFHFPLINGNKHIGEIPIQILRYRGLPMCR